MKINIIFTFWIVSSFFIYQAASEFGSKGVHSFDKNGTNPNRRNVSTSKLSCFICRAVSEFMMNVYLTESSEKCLEAISIQFCNYFYIEDNMVCNSIIKLFKVSKLSTLPAIYAIPLTFVFLNRKKCSTFLAIWC